MDKRTNSGDLPDQRDQKIRKIEPEVFPLKGAKDLSELCFHRYDDVRCIRKNAVYVGKSPLHANKISDFVAAQAPLFEDKSMFWKAIYDGGYMIVDLTTEKDRRKNDQRSLGVKPYYPETLNEDYPFEFHTITLIEDGGALKKYSVQDRETKKVKEVWRFYADWPDHEKVSIGKLAGLVEVMSNNKVWIHCRDGASRAGLVVAAALLHKKIAAGKIHSGNFDIALEKLIDKVKRQRLKSIPHQEQVDLLQEYGNALLGIIPKWKEKKETFSPISMVIEVKKPNYTETSSRIGNLTRRRPEFESGLPAPKQPNLYGWVMQADSKSEASRGSQKPILELVSVYNGLNVDQLWECLISQTPVYGHLFGQIEVFNDDAFPHRFTNIFCIKETVVRFNGEPFHANTVVMNGCKKRFVASQAPHPDDEDKFWQAVAENNYVIFDLTNEKDRIYSDDGSYVTDYCSRRGVKLVNEMGPWTQYKFKYKDVLRFHFSNWQDFQGLTVQKLAFLVDATRNHNKFWVHCHAGAGRSGTFIAACFLQEKISSGEIRKDNYHEALVKLILEIRKQRAHSVQNLKQFTLLYEYGKYLLCGGLI